MQDDIDMKRHPIPSSNDYCVDIKGGSTTDQKRMQERILHALRSVQIPTLSVEDIVIFRNGSFMSERQGDGDPNFIIVRWCEHEKQRILHDWYLDQEYGGQEPSIVNTEPDTSPLDDLIVRVRGWTTMEALKVVRIFEDLDGLSLIALRLTPEAIYGLLADTRAQIG